MHPEIKQIKTQLINSGALNSLMSGSGSSIFGLFDDKINIKEDNNSEIFYVSSYEKGCTLE